MSETWEGRTYTPKPFAGFLYDGKHSFQDFGIYRVSDGSRFNENLLPTLQDKTVQIPGNDGTYYFGSFYTQRQFTVQIAFDNLTDAKLKEMKSWLSGKKVAKLRFDEEPNKFYMAKVTGSATIKHIPFDSEGSTSDTVYKGEGTIQFTCYFPFGRISQIAGEGKWKSVQQDGQKYFDYIVCENQGDLSTTFNCTIELIPPEEESLEEGSLEKERLFVLSLEGPDPGAQSIVNTLRFKVPANKQNISIDTRTKILKIDDNISNFKITSGDFFDLPKGSNRLRFYELTATANGSQKVQRILQDNLEKLEVAFDEIYV